MSIEKSVFRNNDEIKTFLLTNYNIEPINIKALTVGSANCYKIECEKNNYFLKEFQKKFCKEELIKEVEICKLIIEHGIPTSSFVKNTRGFYITEYNQSYVHLQYFIDGFMFERNEMPEFFLYESARILGKINKILNNNIVLSEGFKTEWFTKWRKEDSVFKLESIKENILNRNISIDTKDKLIKSCDIKIELLNKYNEDYLKFLSLENVNSHGDYNNLQILCDIKNKRISGVIDFSSATKIPAVWEIIRSYTYSSNECVSGTEFCLNKFLEYVQQYLKNYKLSRFDLSNMAGFYYFSLLRSNYGLDSENDSLNSFGIWRTNLCKFLSDKYKDIDDYISKNII